MSPFVEVISKIKKENFKSKQGLLQYLLSILESIGERLTEEDKAVIREYIHEEIEALLDAIHGAGCYREKDVLFACENFIVGMVHFVYEGPEAVDPDKLKRMYMLTDLVAKERYLEDTVDKLFEEDVIEEGDIRELLAKAEASDDEFRRAKLYAALIAYRRDVAKLTDGARLALTEYFETELQRYLALEEHTADSLDGLEVACDACREYGSDKVADCLLEILKRGYSAVNFYAVESLLYLKKDVPADAVEALARDVEYACLTYRALEKYGKTALFPQELATDEYLAKSDLVHWLTYPTELGKRPDKIEYVGKVGYLFKKTVYHVFKYCSDSDNLGDELKNKWLIGWSSEDGGTFSNFAEYEKFEKSTVEKTLKNIKKRIIG